MSQQMRAIVGVVGCILIIIGAFGPFIHVPLIGGLALVSGPDGKIMVCMALLGLLAILCGRFGVLWATGGVTAVTVAIDWHTMTESIPMAKTAAQEAVADGGELVSALVDVWTAGIRIGWAWAAIAVGAVLVLAAALGPRGTHKPVASQADG